MPLGQHTLLWEEEGDGTSPVTTDPKDTEVSGSSFLAVYAGYTSNNNAPTDNKGNTYGLLDFNYYVPYGTAFVARIFQKENGVGGTGHTCTVVKNGYVQGEITLLFVELKQAPALADYHKEYIDSGNPHTISIDVDQACTVLAFWFGDSGAQIHTADPDNGFTKIEELLSLPPDLAVQCALAVKSVASAGTVSVTWSHSPVQGAILWLLVYNDPDLAKALLISADQELGTEDGKGFMTF